LKALRFEQLAELPEEKGSDPDQQENDSRHDYHAGHKREHKHDKKNAKDAAGQWVSGPNRQPSPMVSANSSVGSMAPLDRIDFRAPAPP
jgi:hypothetical protein